MTACNTAVKVVSCGEASDAAKTVWQSPAPTWMKHLPGLCTLSYTPPSDTCAIRILFADLALGSPLPAHQSTCSHDAPSFKLHYNGGITPALCTDATGYEGVLEVDPTKGGPLVLVLQLDMEKDFRFRINITAVACGDVKNYKSPTSCGLRNFPGIFDIVEETTEKQTLEEEEEEEVEGGKMEDGGRGGNRKGREMEEEEEEEEEEDEDSDEEEEEEEEGQHRQPRRRKNGNRTNGMRRKEMVKKLRRRTDVFSQALASGVEAGVVRVSNTDRNRRQPWKDSVPGVWPWMVSIERKVLVDAGVTISPQVDPSATQRCTGVLLDQTHVLTSASCVFLPDRTKTVRVHELRAVFSHQHRSRSSSPSSSSAEEEDSENNSGLAISSVSFPLTYNPVRSTNNLAVLTLAEPVRIDMDVRPVCLPVHYNRFIRDNGIVSGWLKETSTPRKRKGSKRNFSSSSSAARLVQADMRVLSRGDCAGTLSNLPYPSQRIQQSMTNQRVVCARTVQSSSPLCQLETGAPLIREDRSNLHYLVGVMGGEGQCGLDYPQLFAEVPSSSTFLDVVLAPPS
ncbi:uncharacterized protein LOC126997272 [Eriocheir sinensis]|uniref:uncharacterized protein LOC126997272 n=1 Tax=Eriocheir sinensis TaxID=95602 RepID=UPI0021C66DE5|nr:uncharacterized protein LOC126997272 [Eriocheir sinensis]